MCSLGAFLCAQDATTMKAQKDHPAALGVWQVPTQTWVYQVQSSANAFDRWVPQKAS